MVTSKSVNLTYQTKLFPDKFLKKSRRLCLLRQFKDRLRAVSLLLENPQGKSSQARVTREREAASSAQGGRRAKRETAMVSYNDCEARHSSDGVILLVDDDAQLSAIFISDMRGEFEPYTLLFLK